jgi:cell division protein FtsQ
VLLVVAAGWGIAWLAQSPLFSVASIEITGAEHATVTEVLADHDVYPGRPLVLIRSGAVADALEMDPWVREASVRRVFPNRIDVEIIERTEVAVVPAADGWRTVSDDGRVMVQVPDPPAGLARVSAAVAVAAPGGDWVS